jgi:hypothetical protein
MKLTLEPETDEEAAELFAKGPLVIEHIGYIALAGGHATGSILRTFAATGDMRLVLGRLADLQAQCWYGELVKGAINA